MSQLNTELLELITIKKPIEICFVVTCSSHVLTDAALDCGPLLVGSGVAGESVGAGQVARRLRVIMDALAAFVALLPVPRVA